MIALAEEYWQWLAWSAVLVVSVVSGAFYAGMETGIYVLNKIRLDLMAESGYQPARRLRRHLRRPGDLLTVLLLGTNISGYAATFAVTGMFVLAGYADSAEWLTLAVAAPVLFICRESVPKNVFQRLSDKLICRMSWPLTASSILFNACGLAPLVRGLGWLVMRLVGSTAGSDGAGGSLLVGLVAEGRASGALTQFQTTLADRVIQIADVGVADVMIPMQDVVWAAEDCARPELLEKIRQHEHSRLPLRGPKGDVTGILDAYELLIGERGSKAASMAKPPLIIDEGFSVTEALYRMQHNKAQMAVVAEHGGRHLGIVTIKDLVEQIVGELTEW